MNNLKPYMLYIYIYFFENQTDMQIEFSEVLFIVFLFKTQWKDEIGIVSSQ